MTDFKFGAVKIDPTAYGSQGSAVLGIRDSGKTYTATELAEKLFEAGIPFTAFDPIGVWRFLRVPGHGRGYPVVVAGGKAGDLPLTVASAPEYVRAAMRDGVSLVIDLFDINLSKADWKRIVTACVRVMLHENSDHGLRHVFIEEAAEFAPQRVGPDQGAVYAEIEKLARMGGNSRLGYTLINQRAEEVNKAVLELCDNLFLHRQKGRNSLTALSKWLDIADVKDHRAIIDSLPNLPTGECWAWMAGIARPIHTKVPVKNSLHPDRRVMRGDGDIKVKSAVDVGSFVTSMRSSLGKIEEEAKANDPAMLRKQIAELQREINQHKCSPVHVAAPIDTTELERRCYATGYAAGTAEIRDSMNEVLNLSDSLGAQFLAKLRDLKDAIEHAVSAVPTPAAPTGTVVTFNKPPPKGLKFTISTRVKAPIKTGVKPTNGFAVELGAGGKRRIMTALAQYPDGMNQRKLSILVDIAPKGGTWRTYMAELRGKGWINGGKDHMQITEEGLQALGEYEPLPTGHELVEYWRRRLGDSGKRAIFDAVVGVYPGSINTNEVSSITGIAQAGGTWRTYMAELRGLGIIEGRGELKAAEDLFE